jgi:hypothetical protein
MCHHKQEGFTVKEAENQAIIDNYPLIENEALLEAECFGLKIKLEQSNRILDSIRTRISYLKYEMNQTRGQI